MAQKNLQLMGATGVSALCDHIKVLKGAVQTIATAFQSTMSEIEEAINDFPVASSITISASGWQAVTPANSVGDYEYYYDITASNIDNNDLPIVSVAPASIATTAACGLSPTCESLNGYIRLYSKLEPEDNITVSCWIIKGQSASEKTQGEASREDVEWTLAGGQS